jgi:hypothetical protein
VNTDVDFNARELVPEASRHRVTVSVRVVPLTVCVTTEVN